MLAFLVWAFLHSQDEWAKKGGLELVYKLDLPKEGKEDALKWCVEALKKRLKAARYDHYLVEAVDKDHVRVRLAGYDHDDASDLKKVFSILGKLELCATAPKAVQEEWNKKCAVDQPLPEPPDGYRSIRNDEKMSGEYGHFGGEYILVSAKPVVTSGQITDAVASPPFAQGNSGWKIDFKLNEEGAKALDLDAKDLFNQNPPGLICVILDGKIRSKLKVKTDHFRGAASIIGRFDEESARLLAAILRSRATLPCLVGRSDKDGKFVAGEPESEKLIAPEKK